MITLPVTTGLYPFKNEGWSGQNRYGSEFDLATRKQCVEYRIRDSIETGRDRVLERDSILSDKSSVEVQMN